MPAGRSPPPGARAPPLNRAPQAFVFDGRNVLDHDALRTIGFEVYAIGKPVKVPQSPVPSA